MNPKDCRQRVHLLNNLRCGVHHCAPSGLVECLREEAAHHELLGACPRGVGMFQPSVIVVEGSCHHVWSCDPQSAKGRERRLVHKQVVDYLSDSDPQQAWYIAHLWVRVHGDVQDVVGQVEEQKQRQKYDGVEVTRAVQALGYLAQK